MNPSSTAILFFSRSAAAEAKAKRLHRSATARQHERLFDGLIRKTLSEAKRSGLHIIRSSEAEQHGASFGERLANAIEEVFRQGYQQTIIIGNDCPGICQQSLNMAEAQLASQQMVIGPSTDGGTYLIGLSRKAYHRQKFVALRWESSHLLEDLQTYSNEQLQEVFMLTPQADLDTSADLLRSLKPFARLRELRWLILNFLQTNIEVWASTPFFYSSPVYTLSSLRAPPLH